MIGNPADRQVAVQILQAQLWAGNAGDERAIKSLRSAAVRTSSARLRQAIGTRASDIADRLIFAGPGNMAVRTSDGLAAAKIATETVTDRPVAWNSYGAALALAGRAGDALAAFDQAVALDPGEAGAHIGRGNVLQALGRFEDALAAYDQAVALDPGHAGAHENKGIALAATGSLNEALAELDTAQHLAPNGAGEGATWAGAIMWYRQDTVGAQERFRSVAGRVTGCTPFRTAEMEAIALCGLGQADAAKQHLLAAVPRRVPGDRPGPRTIYGLMSDPPLPGIERLRKIAEGAA